MCYISAMAGEGNSSTSSGRFSPDEVSQNGERIYFEKLKPELENSHRGEFLVINVATEEYVVDADKLAALDKAEEKFGKGFFYIVQIGEIQKSLAGFRKKTYAWQF